MPSISLVIENTVLFILLIFAVNVILYKQVKQPMQHFNVKKVGRENKVEPWLYLSLTPMVQCGPGPFFVKIINLPLFIKY